MMNLKCLNKIYMPRFIHMSNICWCQTLIEQEQPVRVSMIIWCLRPWCYKGTKINVIMLLPCLLYWYFCRVDRPCSIPTILQPVYNEFVKIYHKLLTWCQNRTAHSIYHKWATWIITYKLISWALIQKIDLLHVAWNCPNVLICLYREVFRRVNSLCGMGGN